MGRRVSVRLGWSVAALAISAAMVGFLAGPAQAHALIRTSDPPNGAVLSKPPTQVVITFTEPPDPKLSFLHVLNSAGKDVESGPSGPAPGRKLELRIPLPPTLPNGVYTVTWRTVSEVDGHVTGNSFTFGIGVTPPPTTTGPTTGPTTPSPAPLAVVGRLFFYWGLALLLGAAVMIPVALGVMPNRGRTLIAASWVGATAGLAMMVASERSTVGVSLGRLLSTGTGHEFVERGVGLAAVALAAGFALARPRLPGLIAVGAAAAGTMLIHVLAGHAAVSAHLTWFNVGVQWMHLLAVGVWVGGLAWLLLGMWGRQDRGSIVRRFSTLAGFALAMVAATGLFRVLDEVGWPNHWGRLFDTSFGWALVVKVGLFGVLVALGALNRYRHVPAVAEQGAPARRLRMTLIAELAVASLILAATGVLSELPPSASLAAVSARPTASSNLALSGSDFATTVRVRITVSPGTVGPNRFDATVTDFDTGRPVPARSVSLQFQLPGRPDLGTPTLPLRRHRGGAWSGQGTVLSIFGAWNVSVLVQEAAGAVQVPLKLTPKLPPESIQTQAAPGQPTLYTIALAGGGQLQTYVDPGRPGNDTVHFTFFQASGNEQPIADASATFVDPTGATGPLPLIRFDAGHFVANTKLTSGRWRFLVQATTAQGKVFDAYFDQKIP
jgi:copper transport protein